jgi:hypothetical protein
MVYYIIAQLSSKNSVKAYKWKWLFMLCIMFFQVICSVSQFFQRQNPSLTSFLLLMKQQPTEEATSLPIASQGSSLRASSNIRDKTLANISMGFAPNVSVIPY